MTDDAATTHRRAPAYTPPMDGPPGPPAGPSSSDSLAASGTQSENEPEVTQVRSLSVLP